MKKFTLFFQIFFTPLFNILQIKILHRCKLSSKKLLKPSKSTRKTEKITKFSSDNTTTIRIFYVSILENIPIYIYSNLELSDKFYTFGGLLSAPWVWGYA